jgi:hypothetical protein
MPWARPREAVMLLKFFDADQEVFDQPLPVRGDFVPQTASNCPSAGRDKYRSFYRNLVHHVQSAFAFKPFRNRSIANGMPGMKYCGDSISRQLNNLHRGGKVSCAKRASWWKGFSGSWSFMHGYRFPPLLGEEELIFQVCDPLSKSGAE